MSSLGAAALVWEGLVGESDLQGSFLALYDREAPIVMRFLRMSIREPADVEDLCGDVFTRAWKAWPRFSGDDREQRAWVMRIARNLAIDAFRRRGRLSVFALDDGATDGGDPATRLHVMDALARLSTAHRHVLALRAAGLSHAEIAAVQGRSETAAKVAWHRAAQRLKAELEAGE